MLKWLLLMLVLSACAVKVVHFTNDDSAFGSYTSFSVVNLKSNSGNLSHDGEKILASVEKAIFDQMTKRDYAYASNPSVVIRYEIISNQETDVSYNPSSFYSPMYGTAFTVRTFLESALLLEMTDLSTKRLVWQASVDMKNFDSIKNQREMIEAAVSQLFDTYLYRAGKKEIDVSLKQSSK